MKKDCWELEQNKNKRPSGWKPKSDEKKEAANASVDEEISLLCSDCHYEGKEMSLFCVKCNDIEYEKKEEEIPEPWQGVAAKEVEKLEDEKKLREVINQERRVSSWYDSSDDEMDMLLHNPIIS